MTRGIAALLSWIFINTALSAQEIEVRGGEHPNYSRISLYVERSAISTSEVENGVFEVTSKGDDVRFETTEAMSRLSRGRIKNVSGDGGVLTISLNCDCRYVEQYLDSGITYFDIYDNQNTASPGAPLLNYDSLVVENGHVSYTDGRSETALTPTHPSHIENNFPLKSEYGRQAFFSPEDASPVENPSENATPSSGNSLASLTENVSIQMTKGILNSTPTPSKAARRSSDSNMAVEGFMGSSVSNFGFQVNNSTSGNGANLPESVCPEENLLDFRADTSAYAGISAISNARIAATDMSGGDSVSAGKSLYKAQIALGLVQESLQLLKVVEIDDRERRILTTVSRVLQGALDPGDNILSEVAHCAPAFLFWSMLSEEKNSQLNRDEENFIFQFNSELPIRLREITSKLIENMGFIQDPASIQKSVLRAEFRDETFNADVKQDNEGDEREDLIKFLGKFLHKSELSEEFRDMGLKILDEDMSDGGDYVADFLAFSSFEREVNRFGHSFEYTALMLLKQMKNRRFNDAMNTFRLFSDLEDAPFKKDLQFLLLESIVKNGSDAELIVASGGGAGPLADVRLDSDVAGAWLSRIVDLGFFDIGQDILDLNLEFYVPADMEDLVRRFVSSSSTASTVVQKLIFEESGRDELEVEGESNETPAGEPVDVEGVEEVVGLGPGPLSADDLGSGLDFTSPNNVRAEFVSEPEGGRSLSDAIGLVSRSSEERSSVIELLEGG